MRTLGVDQFLKKKFKLLDISGKWYDTLGALPAAFVGIVYGKSGNGKTEFLIQLSKYLAEFGRVAWWSYEQGHGYDLQLAVERNGMHEVSGKFMIVDPLAGRSPNFSLFDELMAAMGKRNSPQFFIIDSYDYIRFSQDEYQELKERYGHRKGIIFVSHEQNGGPKRSVAKYIEYDGGFGIQVKKFIAYPNKNRFGGFEPYVIWEERAKELNEDFFK